MDSRSLCEIDQRDLQSMLIDFITVVYDAEVHLLEWQAKSISKYIDPALVNKIVVVDNGSQNCVVKRKWYSNFENKLEVITHNDLHLKLLEHLDGWRTQQLCKILASARSKSEWSVVLDAKTFFAKPFAIDRLFDSGKPCVGQIPVVHHWEDAKMFLQGLYDIKLKSMIGPGGVPFFFHNDTVREMIQSIENFNNWFQEKLYENSAPHRTLVTEFMLYSAFVMKKYGNYTSLYSEKSKVTAFNVSDWEADKFEKIFTVDSHTISVAEKTKSLLDSEQLSRWEAFLYEKFN